eukprot:jgi/Chrzof1/5891/Cz16g19170.t1
MAEASTIQIDPRIKLAVNSTVLQKTGQWFMVSWSGVPSPGFDDWIALMVPAGADPSQTGPAKYKIAALSNTHITQGKGSLTFRLINYRHDMQFAFMRKGMMDPVLAAWSPVITVANPNEPLQGHLALTKDNREMLVQWTTKNSSNPLVKWGSQAANLDSSTPAQSHTYTKAEMCGAPANSVGWVDPGVMHVAKLTGLTPGQMYYYRFGDEAWGFSDVASFLAAPPVGPDTSVQLLAVADLGQGELDGSMEQSEMVPSLNTTRLLNAEQGNYGLFIHNGDISYARGYVTQWDNFMQQIEPITRRMPYMVTPGNHERDWPGSGDRYNVDDSGGECGVAYERRMTMPLPGRDKQWYSFDYGPIHFLQYSTEHAFEPGTEQYKFILDDLRSVNRSRTPWVIVGGHRPFYISSNNRLAPDSDQVVAQQLRAALEDIFLQYKVDMTWHGHHHSYQRSCPIYKSNCVGVDNQTNVAKGPVHLVIGHGGADLSLNVELFPPRNVWQKIKLWWGYLRVQANGTHLHCEAITDSDGSVMDKVTLIKAGNQGEQVIAAAKQRRLRNHWGGGGC